MQSLYGLGILSLSLMAAGVVHAQDYPSKPLRIIAAAAGGGGDFTARLIAQGLSPGLGQPVIVDNRNGTLLASEAASKAPPDGYTLLVNGASLWVIPLLQKVPYDVVNFSPVSLISREVSIFVVHPSLPVKSVKELIALAKARPGELNYAYSSPGSTSHFGGELFRSMTGVNIVGIPYKASVLAITAVMSGEVQLTIFNPSSVAHHVKSGRLRALAVTSLEPSALVPGLPTVAASGLAGYEATSMTGMLAPAKTPAAIINRLNQEIGRVLNRADVKEKFLNAGVETVGSTPEQFAAIIKSDMAGMERIIKNAGIKVD